jgi:hypothetical protein
MRMSGRWRSEFEAIRGYVPSLSRSANHLSVITKQYHYFRLVDTGSKHPRTIRKRACRAFSATVINGSRMTGRCGSATKRRHKSGGSRRHCNPVQDKLLLDRPQNAAHEGRQVIDHIDEEGNALVLAFRSSRRLMATFKSVAFAALRKLNMPSFLRQISTFPGPRKVERSGSPSVRPAVSATDGVLPPQVARCGPASRSTPLAEAGLARAGRSPSRWVASCAPIQRSHKLR